MVKVLDAINATNGNAMQAVLTEPRLRDAATIKAMSPKWSDPPTRSAILFELTCLKAAAKRFVEATYLLEGDEPVSMVAFDIIAGINSAMTQLLPDMDFGAVQTAAEQCARAAHTPPPPNTQVKCLHSQGVKLHCRNDHAI
jgi:hypothetical protein